MRFGKLQQLRRQMHKSLCVITKILLQQINKYNSLASQSDSKEPSDQPLNVLVLTSVSQVTFKAYMLISSQTWKMER